jgi:diguanylate cyclase (GGDEF)-like protein
MGGKTIGARWAAFALGAGMVLSLGVVAVLVIIAGHADAAARQREEVEITHGLNAWTRDLQKAMSAETNWDEAAANLGVTYDPAWTSANIGQFFHQQGQEAAYVLNAAHQPIYAMEYGKNVSPDRFAALAADAGPLIAKVRQAEAQRPTPVGAPPFETFLTKPIQASSLQRRGDHVFINTATLVQVDFGTVTLEGPAPIVVTSTALDADFIKDFSDRYLLNDLAVSPGPTDAGRAQAPLMGRGGAPISYLSWTPQRPGRALLKAFLPPMGLALVLLMSIAAANFLRGRKAGQALIVSESRARHLMAHDPLTGLPNRLSLNERLAAALAAPRGTAVGLLIIELDRLREINDTLGHGAGDELIVAMAKRLRAQPTVGDAVARIGGGNFAILRTGAKLDALTGLAAEIVGALGQPANLTYGRVEAGAWVGVTLVEAGGAAANEAMRQAGLALRRAKADGGARSCVFEPDMDQARTTRREMEVDLRAALAEGDLNLVYEPQVDEDDLVVGVEGSVRWLRSGHGLVSPAVFTQAAQDCDLTDALSEFTLRRAFTDSLRWPHLTVAVDVSAGQIGSPGFPALVARLLRETKADPTRIELEITEALLTGGDKRTQATLGALRAVGFSLALDDFGGGASSLAYLRRHRVDKLKIDRSFVIGLGTAPEPEAMVHAIVTLARGLNTKIVAQGVETDLQRQALRRAGCGHVQGAWFSGPVTADEIDANLAPAEAARLSAAG